MALEGEAAVGAGAGCGSGAGLETGADWGAQLVRTHNVASNKGMTVAMRRLLMLSPFSLLFAKSKELLYSAVSLHFSGFVLDSQVHYGYLALLSLQ